MLNSIVLIGRLTKDPELKYLPSGKALCTMRLAVDRGTTNAQGEKEVDFIDCLAWEKQGENVANYKKKGDLIAVQGRLQIRTYETQEGQRREKAEVVANAFGGVRFLDSGRDSQQDSGGSRQGGGMGSELTFTDEEGPPF